MKSAVSSRRLSGVNESELHCHQDSGLLLYSLGSLSAS